VQYGEKRWTDTALQSHLPVVLPLGSLEQHGHHMPMLTDSMIIGEIARRAEQILAQEALFLPVLWTGASDHHMRFAGTLSIHNNHYVQLLEDILESLLAAGYRRIFLLNGHGGNITPARQAVYNVHLRHHEMTDLTLAFSSWWHIAAPQLAALETVDAETVTHACEMETSMILNIRPDLVDMSLAVGAHYSYDSRFWVPDFSAPSLVDVPRTFDQLSTTGAFGYPETATPQKGEALYRVVVEQVAAFIREFVQWKPTEGR
jgi:creatinine amidohydrolase